MNRADESPYLLARKGGLALGPLWARVATSAGGRGSPSPFRRYSSPS
jgi:hypothetical protein